MHGSGAIVTAILSLASLFSPARAWCANGVAEQSHLNPAFFRAWRSKPDKRMTAITFKPEGDATRISVGPDYYAFKYDGKGYPMSNEGYSAVWKRPDGFTLESAIKVNGDVIIRAKWVISPDGKSMRVTHEFKNGATTAVALYEKGFGASAFDPLMGTWQLPDSAGCEAVTLEPAGNGIKFTSSFGAGYTAAFDNQDHPVAGSNYPPGTTVGLRRMDDHMYEETWKRHGDPFARSQFALSSDGAVLTQTWISLQARLKKQQPRVVTYGK